MTRTGICECKLMVLGFNFIYIFFYQNKCLLKHTRSANSVVNLRCVHVMDATCQVLYDLLVLQIEIICNSKRIQQSISDQRSFDKTWRLILDILKRLNQIWRRVFYLLFQSFVHCVDPKCLILWAWTSKTPCDNGEGRWFRINTRETSQISSFPRSPTK